MLDFLRKFKKKEVGGHKILLRRRSIDFEVFDYVFKEKYHRPYKELNKDAIILDLGTNIGLTIVDFKILRKDCIIYGYEMDKDNFGIAVKNTKDLDRVHLFNKAVWFENSTFTYSKKGNFDAYKLESANQDHELVTVSTISLNQIVKDNNLSRIDYVKMDIEGAEKEVFEHDLDWLDITREIKIEVHYPKEVFEFIMTKLNERGFTTFKDTHHWSTIIGYRQ